ncbi:hypothetical protein J2125_003750 [Erwinia toletana]|uniref:Uncharacterized protein n=1 Tax=Winslowiella toletana TaxID=92490 RepID=A0ABS4PD43_9GAMM|nr:hypothetical protein [Winslowiella toletana]MBP2170558.1 hypothetical protein [Winslowiella toletana]
MDAINSNIIINNSELSKGVSSEYAKIYNENTSTILHRMLPASDPTTDKIDKLFVGDAEQHQGFHCITFLGYSGLGYKDLEKLKEALKSELDSCLAAHADKQIVLVCGGTSAGIGVVYDVVNEYASLKEKIKLIGIVSEVAPENDLAKNDVSIIRVPDPDNTWETKKVDGNNIHYYMLYPVLKYDGEVQVWGGGKIAYDEAEAAIKLGIKTTFFRFEPDSSALQKKLDAGKTYQELCPVIYHEFMR